MKKLIPPIIVFTIAGLSAFLIWQSIEFISYEINRVFTINQERVDANIISLDLEEFELVTERLDIESTLPDSSPDQESHESEEQTPETMESEE